MENQAAAARGEEFRDDLRGTAASQVHAGAAQVRRLLPAETLADLTRLSALRSTLAIATTFGTIALVLGVAWTYFTWWIVVPAVFLIGTQQHALFVLAHDSAHYRLYGTRWLNDAIGRFVGTIGGVSMMSYRVIHRLHHNNLYGEVDPDIALHGGYPRGKAYLLKKLAKDICGLTAYKTYAYFFGNPAINANHPAGAAPARRYIGRATYRGAARSLGRGCVSHWRSDRCVRTRRSARAREVSGPMDTAARHGDPTDPALTRGLRARRGDRFFNTTDRSAHQSGRSVGALRDVSTPRQLSRRTSSIPRGPALSIAATTCGACSAWSVREG